MGFGGLVYHGLNQWVIEFFIISNGIETFRMGVISLGNNGYGVFLWLLVRHDRIAVDIIACYLGIRIELCLLTIP